LALTVKGLFEWNPYQNSICSTQKSFCDVLGVEMDKSVGSGQTSSVDLRIWIVDFNQTVWVL